MNYTVVIQQDGETARLPCFTLEEAEQVRRSFVNWGGMGYDICIEQEYSSVDSTRTGCYNT